MPFAVALMMHLVNPGSLEVLFTDPGGRKMLTVAPPDGMGILVIRKVTRIRL
jgi:tight adherence protein B